MPETKKDTRPSYHLFPLRIRNITEEKRDKIISILAEKGISVNVHFNPLPNLTYFKKLGYDISDYPVAQKLYRSEISLPIYPQLKNVEVEYLVGELLKAYQKGYLKRFLDIIVSFLGLLILSPILLIIVDFNRY